MSTHLVAESLIYPCMLWLFLLGYCVAEKPEKMWRAAAFGVANGIAYFAKPECIVFGVSFALVGLLWGMKHKRHSHIIGSAVSLAALMVVVALGYAVYSVLFDQTSLLSLYEKQIPTLDVKTILIMLQGTVYHVLAIVFSAGVVTAIFPLLSLRYMRKENQWFYQALLVSMLVMIVGIGVMIVPYQYEGTWISCPTHTRYLAYFLPPIMAGLFLPEIQGKRLTNKSRICLWVFVALLVFPGPFNVFTTQAGTYDSPSLNLFFAHKAGYVLGAIALIALVGCDVYLIRKMEKLGFHSRIRNMTCTIMVVCMITNGLATYVNYIPMERRTDVEAQAVSEMLGNDEYLIVTNNLYDDFRSFQLDSHMRKPRHMVVMNNVLLNAVENQGGYSSFEPVVQAPNTDSTPTPENVETLLFGVSCAPFVEFASGVELEQTPGGMYTIAHIQQGKPYLKTALASIDGYTLRVNDIGSLIVYDQEILKAGRVKLIIQVRSANGQSGEITYSCNGETITLPIEKQTTTHEVELPVTQTAFFHFTLDGTVPVAVHSYSTEAVYQ